MIKQIQNLSEFIIYDHPVLWNELAIMPFKLKKEFFKNYIGISDAVKKENFLCKELDELARVSQIKCINKTRSNVLIIEGEHIIGGNQNRVVNLTTLIRKNSTVVLPVTCVEEGRWSILNKKFKDSRNFALFDLRKRLRKSVNKSYRTKRNYESEQSSIWDTVHKNIVCRKVVSMTGAMEDIYSTILPKLTIDFSKFKLKKDVQGLILFNKAQVVNVEFMSNSNVFSNFYEKYIRSLIISSDKSNLNVEADYEQLANNFFEKLSKIELQPVEPIGIGQNYVGSVDDMNISLLTYENDLVYLSIL